MFEFKKENIKKWRGIRNSDTGEIDSGYLYFQQGEEEDTLMGIRVIGIKNKSEAKNKFIAGVCKNCNRPIYQTYESVDYHNDALCVD